MEHDENSLDYNDLNDEDIEEYLSYYWDDDDIEDKE